MKSLLEPRSLRAPQRWITLLVSLTLFLGVFGSLAWLVRAEGSRNLYPNMIGGNRANVEWRSSFYGANFLRRRMLLQVYAEQNEVILLGSSAVAVGSGDILVYNPGQVTGVVGDETIPGPPAPVIRP